MLAERLLDAQWRGLHANAGVVMHYIVQGWPSHLGPHVDLMLSICLYVCFSRASGRGTAVWPLQLVSEACVHQACVLAFTDTNSV